MMVLRNLLWFGVSVVLAGCSMPSVTMTLPEDVAAAQNSLPDSVDYNRHIKPLLSDRCFICHGPDANQRQAGLRLDLEEGAYAPLASGAFAIQPGDVPNSRAAHRILSDDPHVRMPPPESNLSLNAQEKAMILRWIEQGAKYQPHWSFIPLSETQAPAFSQDPDVTIDTFIEKQLQQQGGSFSEEADKATLIRRVGFDLTGLPPTPDEIDAFLADESPNAYEKVVDRLLASPQYGERMALEWLDVARYADTYGYQADNERPTWRWRDWVIDAYNQNMPFDEFITHQLAGDLLPNPTTDQLIATGFNRNHPQNAEGGIINEEFRVEYVADRAITTGRAFLGLTMECARCHDHKYDPITQKEFYRFFSFFNNIDEAGQITWSKPDMPSPTLLLFTDDEKTQIAELDEKIAKLEAELLEAENQKDLYRKRRNALIEKFPLSTRGYGSSLGFEDVQGSIAKFSYRSLLYDKMISNSVGEATGRIVDPVTMKIWDEEIPHTGNVDIPRSRVSMNTPGIQVDGDAMLDFPNVGRFKKADPFTIVVDIWIPKDLKEGVIFHSNRGGIIYSFKGYQVSIENDRFDVRLAHTFPYNSIHLISEEPSPREEWIQIALTYNGSGKAAGVGFYLNGNPVPMEVKRNNLYKDIVFVHDGITTNLRAGARWRSRGFTNGKLGGIWVYDRELIPLEIRCIFGGFSLYELIYSNESLLLEEDRQSLNVFYLHNYDEEYQRLLAKLRELRQTKNDIYENAEEILITAEMPEPRQAYLLERGAYNARGEPVEPVTPAHILAFDESLPKNRLGLSQWLTDPNNPLTARVAVNRYWQIGFGKGLVKTAEDFGSQGDPPTHPDLLDWLAWQYIQSGWDTQAMMKRIVLSKTYRQSSVASETLLQKDPENRFYARGPVKRLPAEFLRDQALAAGGLLVKKIGGASVKPYQPEGLWSFGSNSRYEQSSADDLYRRGMYTFWKRTVPPPAMSTFDAPDRSYCIMRRQKTNTPMQALVLMNDPQFLEAAKMTAVHLLQREEPIHACIQRAFRLYTARIPNEQENAVLQSYYADVVEQCESNHDIVSGILGMGETMIPSGINQPQAAALTLTVSTIMNADAAVFLR